MRFRATPRAEVKAELMERRRLKAEAKTLKDRLRVIAQCQTTLSSSSIAQRHGVPVSFVYFLSARMHDPLRKLRHTCQK